MSSKRKMFVIVLAVLGFGPLIVNEAYAVVGMPLTPVSYAGVARRSVRRAYY